MKKIGYLLIATFLFSCSNDFDSSSSNITPNEQRKEYTENSRLRVNTDVLSDALSNDENFKNMMKELTSLKLDLADKKNKYKSYKVIDNEDFNNRIKMVKTKEDLVDFYSFYMTNSKGFVDRLDKASKFATKFVETYKAEINSITDSEKREVMKSAIQKFNKKNKLINARVLVNDMGCVGVCNNTWGQQEDVCRDELAVGVGIAAVVGLATGGLGGSAAFLAAGATYYFCSRSAEIDLIGCLSGC